MNNFFMVCLVFLGIPLARAECAVTPPPITELQKTPKEYLTNPCRSDGFGAQFQSIIYYALYAELHDMEFIYTPFASLEHNYNNDVEFNRKKEELINFIGNFEVNTSLELQDKVTEEIFNIRYQFVETNLTACANTQILKKIKAAFRANKHVSDYFDGERLNIAVHIRRPNIHDSRIGGTDLPDHVYLKNIDRLRGIYTGLFH